MKKELISLGIESSAYAFGVGIVTEAGKILANEKVVYKPKAGQGLVPNEAQEFHLNNSKNVLKSALEKAKLSIEDIDIISYTAGAGMPLCLLVGANLAISLSKKFKKPLVPVCHQVAHLEIGKLTTQAKDPIFLYLSGGNTQIIAFTEGKYRIFGETEDVPVGNCLDMAAREMKLPMPGGVEIEKLAVNGKYIELPYVVKGMDLSFSGIATAAISLLKKGISKEDISYSLQETCFAMLTEVTERAIAHTNKEEVLLVGGVAANKRLQEMISIMCKERGANFFVVPQEYAQDNGAQTAWVGVLAYNSCWKNSNILKNKINSKWRIDDVEITWVENKSES
jgi:N6-L-threonylcarbamoyladenine synthase/protein kinase Bud32